MASTLLIALIFQVSVFMLTCITMDRVITILFPLNVGRFRLKHARIVAVMGWCVCTFLTLLPVFGVSYFGDAFFGRTGKRWQSEFLHMFCDRKKRKKNKTMLNNLDQNKLYMFI